MKPLKTLALIAAALPYTAFAENVPQPVQTSELQTVNVTGKNRSTRTENRDSYTTSAMRTTTGLALSPKETPQSVSVITKTQINEQGITNLVDALKPPPVSTSSVMPVFRASNRAGSISTKSKKTEFHLPSPAPSTIRCMTRKV